MATKLFVWIVAVAIIAGAAFLYYKSGVGNFELKRKNTASPMIKIER